MITPDDANALCRKEVGPEWLCNKQRKCGHGTQQRAPREVRTCDTGWCAIALDVGRRRRTPSLAAGTRWIIEPREHAHEPLVNLLGDAKLA